MLGSIEVHAGDFKKGNWSQLMEVGFPLPEPDHFLMKIDGQFLREKISVYQIDQLEIATEENVMNLGSAAGWGLAGAVLLGPVGLLAGLIAGGRGKKVTFVCKFKDGRKFLGSAKAKTYTKMAAVIFK